MINVIPLSCSSSVHLIYLFFFFLLLFKLNKSCWRNCLGLLLICPENCPVLVCLFCHDVTVLHGSCPSIISFSECLILQTQDTFPWDDRHSYNAKFYFCFPSSIARIQFQTNSLLNIYSILFIQCAVLA